MKVPLYALLMAERGIPTFPCNAQKRPVGGHGFKDATTDPKAMEELWRRLPGPLIGMPCGEASGLDLLDIDPRHDGEVWLAEFAPYLGDTRTVQTRSGGIHFFYNHLPGVRNSEGQIADGVDTRGEGGYAILWEPDGGFVVRDLPVADWPEWLGVIALNPPKRKKKASELVQNLAQVEPRRFGRTSGDAQTIYAKRKDTRTAEEFALDMIADAIVRVERAGGGHLHYTLRAASRLVGGLYEQAGITETEAGQKLYEAAKRAGAEDLENAAKTIASGIDLGKSEKLQIKAAS